MPVTFMQHAPFISCAFISCGAGPVTSGSVGPVTSGSTEIS